MFAMGPAFFEQAAPAPPSGPTRVAVASRASGPTLGRLGYSYSLTLTGVKAGDLIAVLRQVDNASDATITDGTNTYTTDYNNTGSANNGEYVYHAIAAADAASLTLSFSSSGNAFGIVAAVVYRAPTGKTWAFDSSNFSVTVGSYSAADLSKTFNTSGPGIVLVGCDSANYDNSATYGVYGTCTGADIQAESTPNATGGFGYFGFIADYLSSAALSSHIVTAGIYTTTPNDTNSRKDLVVAPFTYS